jgi:hypothetical protein
MNDFYELVNRYLAMFEGASVKFHEDVNISETNAKSFVSRRTSCDLYLGVNIDLEQANTATTVICRVSGLDWPFHSRSGDNFIYSKDSAIVEAMGGTSTLPPEYLDDTTAWTEPEDTEEDASSDGSSPTTW